MLGVFSDTIVICTCTAAIVLFADANGVGGDLTGVALTQAALSAEVGEWGSSFVAIALLFFAFTSIVANYYFGETSVVFIFGKRSLVPVFRIIVLGFVVSGALARINVVWSAADLSMGLMALFNLVAIILLSPVGLEVMRDYLGQLSRGEEPEFDKRRFPRIADRLHDDVW